MPIQPSDLRHHGSVNSYARVKALDDQVREL